MLRLGLLIAAAVVLFDQATKTWIVHIVMAPPRVIEVTGFFNIVMVWNTGASFGLFGSESSWAQVVLGGVAVGICAALVVWLARAESRWLAVALGLVIGGAAGNLIDRIAYGAVADFLDFHAYGWHWPAFNVADSAICIGVGMLLLDGLIAGRSGNKLKA